MVDLTVSRDDFVRNDKFKQFLESIYKSLLDGIHRIVEEKYASDNKLMKCVKFSQYLNYLFRDTLGENIEAPKSNFIRLLTLSKKYLVLTKKGTSLLSWNAINKTCKSKVYHYKLPIEFAEEHTETVKSIFISKMADDEVFVFDIEPHLDYIKYPRKFVCGFCESLGSIGEIAFECHDIKTLLQRVEYEQIESQLSLLLPSGSYFSRLPDSLKSVVVETKSFGFSPPLDTFVSSTHMERLLNLNLVARELLANNPEMIELYEYQLSSDEKRIKIISTGQFVYDANDEILKFLISKADNILLDELLMDLCKKYFRLLALYFKAPSIWTRYRKEHLVIILLEQTLTVMLGFPDKYIGLNQRGGNLSLIYY